MDQEKLIKELTRDEGLRLKPYMDTTGHVTIGVGRNLTDVGISEDEATYLLQNDIARTVADMDKHIPWWSTLDEVRQRVLVNMSFNLGVAGLLTFVNTLKAVQDGRYVEAGEGLTHSLWYRQVGPRADRLIEMMKTGVEP